jgi:hypothetical protein
MSFKCDICEKIFNTSQHLNQHKNRKKPCQKNSQISNKSELSEQDILEIINNQNVLIHQNTILKSNIAMLEKEISNIRLKKQLTIKFIKFILNYDDVDEEILEQLSLLLTNAENEKASHDLAVMVENCKKYKNNYPYRNKNNNYPNSVISSNNSNSSANSIISDLTITPSSIILTNDNINISNSIN